MAAPTSPIVPPELAGHACTIASQALEIESVQLRLRASELHALTFARQVDGYELARRLRAQAGARRMTLVAVTGYGQEQDRERARRAGFDHHLVKPADTTVLASLLEAAAEAATA